MLEKQVKLCYNMLEKNKEVRIWLLFLLTKKL